MKKHKSFENKVWLSSPYMHGEEQKFVQEAFDTNWIAPLGPNVSAFEKEVASYVGTKHAAACSSGTAALHLAYKLSGAKEGDVVLCSDMTFSATANAIVYDGATPVFIDSEYETWNMDPDALEKALEKYKGKVKAVCVVHLYGVPSKLDKITALCEEYNVALIEDAAESLGATYKGQQTGSFSDYSIVSFNGNKIITSSGGGMLLSDDEEVIQKAIFWSTQARDQAPWYQHSELGYNYRMSNIVAGVGRGQLLHLDEHVAMKKHIYMNYQEGLADLPITMNPYLEDSEPNFWLSCLTINEDKFVENEIDPNPLREHLLAYNVETRPIWKPMHMQPFYQECDFVSVSDKPVNEDVFKRGLCLASDLHMDGQTQEIVIEMIQEFFE